MTFVAGEMNRVPASVVHAKTMGTMHTLCGQATLNWVKFWSLPFAEAPAERCIACLALARTQATLRPSL